MFRLWIAYFINYKAVKNNFYDDFGLAVVAAFERRHAPKPIKDIKFTINYNCSSALRPSGTAADR